MNIHNLNNDQEVLKKIEQACDEISTYIASKSNRNVRTLSIIAALRTIRERLLRIQDLIKIEKYNLAFIGKIGVGKTTAICHLFNLILNQKKIIKEDDENREIQSVKEILSTASGRTTICEVVIRANNQISLEIDPYSEEEVQESIKVFCALVWKKCHPKSLEFEDISESELDKEDALPAELKRAISNLTGLKEVTRQSVQVDEAHDLAMQYEKYEDFRDEVIQRGNLPGRAVTLLQPHIQALETPTSRREWIEETFKKINLCLLPNVSIPRRIYINLQSDILDLEEYPFQSIIDTRGIAEVRDREDLASHIKDDATICIFTERFIDAPISTIDIIGKYLTRESEDVDTKFVMLAMPRYREPAEMMGQNGRVESRDEGVRVRASQVRDSFDGKNIKFISENVLFYDALRYFDDEYRTLKNHCSQSRVDKEKNFILDQLSEVIKRRRVSLIDQAHELIDRANRIKVGIFSDEDKRAIEALKKTIIEYTQEDNFLFDFRQSYVFDYLKRHHIMVFRALNNRFGIYEYRGINIYFDSKNLAEELLRKRFEAPKSEIIGAIKNTQERALRTSGSRFLSEVLEVLREQVDRYYEEILHKIGTEIRSSIELRYLEDVNSFWLRVQGRWGKGKGYKNDVLEMYRKRLAGVDEFLEEKSQQIWQQEFMSKILEFFEPPSEE